MLEPTNYETDYSPVQTVFNPHYPSLRPVRGEHRLCPGLVLYEMTLELAILILTLVQFVLSC